MIKRKSERQKLLDIIEILEKNHNKSIALYGLGTETERLLSELGNEISVAGLLDGFEERGEIYGYPIIPITETVSKGVGLIIVVARPGSCRVIAKRIGAFCAENGIALFDVYGKDLLAGSKAAFDFESVQGESRQKLYEMIEAAQVVSFDLFDTLITRKVLSYTDIFELMDIRLRDIGIIIPDFPKLRLYSEKELSKLSAPKLTDIYRFVLKKSGGSFISAHELASMEWELDFSTMMAREDVCDIFKKTIADEKKVVITTDSYYTLSQIRTIFDRFGLDKPDEIFVSCEYKTSKMQTLFGILKDGYCGKRILHVGDDEIADMKKASGYGFDTYRIYSGADLYDSLGGLGLDDEIRTLSDKLKIGMFISNVFNSPFWFEEDARRLSINDSVQVGYLFCAPIVTDFVLWMKRTAKEQGYGQILFCARDGYLPGKLYRIISPDTKSVYFLTSRTAAIRAGMEDNKDIEYVDSMKYFGTPEEALKIRFGIFVEDISKIERQKEILWKAVMQREKYKRYIEKLDIQDAQIGMFDFVAKGTTQMYLQKLFSQHMKGFYFLRLEPEFMADKELDIEPFYSDEEKKASAIFDNYYILETILTSPYSQMEEFGENGAPVFADETRGGKDIKVLERAQAGITDYFKEYMRLLPESARIENKMLDEKMLALIHRIQIKDEDFRALQVEDSFFGRMTAIADVIG